MSSSRTLSPSWIYQPPWAAAANPKHDFSCPLRKMCRALARVLAPPPSTLGLLVTLALGSVFPVLSLIISPGGDVLVFMEAAAAELMPHLRAQAAETLRYEAQCRIQDPISGCVGVISQLHQQIQDTECQLAKTRAEVALMNSDGQEPPQAQADQQI